MGRSSRPRRQYRGPRQPAAPGPMTPTIEGMVYSMITVGTPAGMMVDPTALERLLKALLPIVSALEPDAELTPADREWLDAVRGVRDAIASVPVHFTAQLTKATITPVDEQPPAPDTATPG